MYLERASSSAPGPIPSPKMVSAPLIHPAVHRQFHTHAGRKAPSFPFPGMKHRRQGYLPPRLPVPQKIRHIHEFHPERFSEGQHQKTGIKLSVRHGDAVFFSASESIGLIVVRVSQGQNGGVSHYFCFFNGMGDQLSTQSLTVIFGEIRTGPKLIVGNSPSGVTTLEWV